MKSMYSIITMTVAAFLLPAVHAGVNENSYEILENGAGKFRVDIEGCPVASANVETIDIEDVVIDEVEIPAPDLDFRVYGPGDAHFGSITIRCRQANENRNELFQWWLDSIRKEFVRKDIVVTALDKKGRPVREYRFLECFPTRWDPGEYSPSSKVAGETIVAKMQRVELAVVAPDNTRPGKDKPVKDKPYNPDDMLVVLGFTVAVDPADPTGAGSGSDPDSAWETCSGGSLNIEVSDSSTGSDQFHTTTPGHKYVDTLTLRGPLTSGRKGLCDWITESVGGRAIRATVTLKEITKDAGAGRTFTYLDCFPTRYVFPAFSASGTGNLYEEVAIKPIRLELQ